MTGHMHLYVVARERFVWLRGTDGARQWLKARDVPALWSRRDRAFLIRTERLSDLITMAEVEGWTVHEHHESPDTRWRER